MAVLLMAKLFYVVYQVFKNVQHIRMFSMHNINISHETVH